MTGDIEHPTKRIKRSALMTCIALLLVIRDVWKIRELADQAREIEGDARSRLGREITHITDEQRERIAELQAQIAQLRATGFQPDGNPPSRRGTAYTVDGQAVDVDAAAPE